MRRSGGKTAYNGPRVPLTLRQRHSRVARAKPTRRSVHVALPSLAGFQPSQQHPLAGTLYDIFAAEDKTELQSIGMIDWLIWVSTYA